MTAADLTIAEAVARLADAEQLTAEYRLMLGIALEQAYARGREIERLRRDLHRAYDELRAFRLAGREAAA